MKRASAILAAILFATLAWSQAQSASSAPDMHDWGSWGNGLRFDHFSTADQINRTNVVDLKPVWEYVLPQHGGWELTPIVVNGVLYGQDMAGNAFALDPETGKEIWKFASGQRGNNRAVAYWPGDTDHKPRIILSVGERIYALDAATGQQVRGFGGSQGYINIRDGFAEPGPSYRVTSPVTVYKNLLITGVSTQEFGSKGPPGDPRAYDAITGKLVWRFHIVPRPGEPNFGTWGKDGWKGRSGPTTWGMISVDQETGLAFIPIGQPADNFVGIDRPGDNLYSDSVLALDATTGKYRWHFQMVHHDLWDYDVSAPATLIDLNVKGKTVPALVEVTKQGMMFILDRRTGKPVFGVEERPVPKSMIPGEESSPTQPFPIKPVPLAKLGVSRADISTITPAVHEYCTAMWNRMGMKNSPAFTPSSLFGANIFMPSNSGGAGGVWGGVSIDPRTGYIFVNVTNMIAYNYIVPDDGKTKGPSSSGYRTNSAFTKWMDPNGLPCVQPPWGEMVAVNGNTGDIAWRRPLGKAEVYRDLGANTGFASYAGSLATAGGLVFIGGTTMACSQCLHDDPEIRAFDTTSGQELWHTRLPAATKSNPMTFVGKNGRQYLVVTSSGRPDTDIAMIAFALPRPGDVPVDIHPAPLPPSALGQAEASLPAENTVSDVADLPPGPGKDDVAKVCTVCHTISTVTSAPRDLGGWTATVEEMRSRGAKMDDAGEKRIISYLVGHFGRK